MLVSKVMAKFTPDKILAHNRAVGTSEIQSKKNLPYACVPITSFLFHRNILQEPMAKRLANIEW